MSDSDLEELPNTGWFDLESALPGISSVDSTIKPGVIVSSPSVSQIHVRALYFGDSSAMGIAPNKGTTVGHVPLEGTGFSKGENFLDTPIYTHPQSKSPSLQPFHRGWPIVRGRGMGREGQKNSTLTRQFSFLLILFSQHFTIL